MTANRKITAASFTSADEHVQKIAVKLPLPAQRKLLRCEEASLVSSGFSLARAERLAELTRQKQDFRSRAAHWQRHPQLTSKEQAQVDDWLRQAAEVHEEILELQNAKRPDGGYPSPVSLYEFLAETKTKSFRDARFQPSEADHTADPPKELEKARAKTINAAAKIKKFRSATFSLEEAIQQAEHDIEAKATQGAPNVRRLFLRDTGESSVGRPTRGTIVWPTEYLTGLSAGQHAEMGVAFTCWLFKDQVLARCEAELRANFKPDIAMTTADRTKKLADAESDLLRLERIEEYWCERCEAAGLPAERRGVSPLAFLGIAPA